MRHGNGRRHKHYNKHGYGKRFNDVKQKFRHINRDGGQGLYRSRNGVFMGICQGIGDYFDLSVFWIRTIFVLCFFFGGVFPILVIYVIAGLIIKPEPVIPLRSDEDHEFYDSYINSRSSAIQRTKRKFDSLNRRLQRMEDCVTSREFEWDQKMKR